MMMSKSSPERTNRLRFPAPGVRGREPASVT